MTRGVRRIAAPVALVATALLAGRAPAQQARAGRPAEAAEAVAGVRKLLADQQTAWNHGDLAGFMEGYWKSDSLTFYSAGDVQQGWRAAYDRYVRRYQSEGREMGRLDFEIHAITPLGRDVALVRGAWFLKRGTDAPHGLFTLVLRRFPRLGWRIVHDHTSSAE